MIKKSDSPMDGAYSSGVTPPRPPEGKHSPCECRYVGDPVNGIAYCPMHELAPKFVAVLETEHKRNVDLEFEEKEYLHVEAICGVCALLKEARRKSNEPYNP